MGKRISDKDVETELIFKRSTNIMQTHSGTSSGVSQLSKTGILQIKKKLSQHKFYTEGGKIKRDLSIETDICVMRRYFKHKRDKMSNRDTKSAKSRYSYNTEIDTIEELNHDEDSASGDSLRNVQFNVDVETLMVNNFKDLLQKWINQHVRETQGDKQVIKNAIDAVLGKIQTDINIQPSSSGTTYVLESTPQRTETKSMITSLDLIYPHSYDQSSTVTSLMESDNYSWYSIPTFYKKLKIISTLSIPRKNNIKKNGIRKKDRKFKVIRRNYKNIIVSVDKANTFLAESSSVDLLGISTKLLLSRCVDYIQKQNNKQAISNNNQEPPLFLPEPSLVSATVSTNTLNVIPLPLKQQIHDMKNTTAGNKQVTSDNSKKAKEIRDKNIETANANTYQDMAQIHYKNNILAHFINTKPEITTKNQLPNITTKAETILDRDKNKIENLLYNHPSLNAADKPKAEQYKVTKVASINKEIKSKESELEDVIIQKKKELKTIVTNETQKTLLGSRPTLRKNSCYCPTQRALTCHGNDDYHKIPPNKQSVSPQISKLNAKNCYYCPNTNLGDRIAISVGMNENEEIRSLQETDKFGINVLDSFDIVNRDVIANSLTNHCHSENYMKREKDYQPKYRNRTLSRKIVKRKKCLLRKTASYIPLFKDIQHKDFTYLYKHFKENTFQQNDLLKHFVDIFRYFMNFEGNRNMTLDIHVNVFPVFESGTEVDVSQTSKLDPKEIKTSPTIIYHVTSTGLVNAETPENRSHSLKKSASHSLVFKPEIIPLLDAAASHAKYIVNRKIYSLAKYKNNIQQQSHVTDRATNTIDVAVVQEIGQLKAKVKQLALTAQELLTQHSLYKKNNKTMLTSHDNSLYEKRDTKVETVSLKEKLKLNGSTSRISKVENKNVTKNSSPPSEHNIPKNLNENCKLFVENECPDKNKKLIRQKVPQKEITIIEQNKIKDITISKYDKTGVTKSRSDKKIGVKQRKSCKQKKNKSNFMNESRSVCLLQKDKNKKLKFKSLGTQISSRFKHIRGSAMTFKMGPKKCMTYESENKLPDRHLSCCTIESESVLKVTDMVSSICCYSYPKSSKIDQALTTSLPITRSLYEMSTQSTMDKPDIMTYYCDATIPTVLKGNADYVLLTPCPSNKIPRHKKYFNRKVRPDFCEQCQKEKQESCESLLSARMATPNTFIVKCSDCNREFQCSSVHLNSPSRIIKVKERRNMGKAEGVFYCFVLWIPVFLLLVTFYHLVLVESSTQSKQESVSNNKSDLVSLTDLGF